MSTDFQKVTNFMQELLLVTRQLDDLYKRSLELPDNVAAISASISEAQRNMISAIDDAATELKNC